MTFLHSWVYLCSLIPFSPNLGIAGLIVFCFWMHLFLHWIVFLNNAFNKLGLRNFSSNSSSATSGFLFPDAFRISSFSKIVQSSESLVGVYIYIYIRRGIIFSFFTFHSLRFFYIFIGRDFYFLSLVRQLFSLHFFNILKSVPPILRGTFLYFFKNQFILTFKTK